LAAAMAPQPVVVSSTGVVATHHPRYPPQPPLYNCVVEGTERASIETTQSVVDVLMGEPSYQVIDLLRDARFLTVGEVVNPHLHDLLGDLQSMVFVKLPR